MGIRAKLFWLYLITFGLMASMASWLLLSLLQANFNEIEAKQTEMMMAQLLRNFDAELTHLNDLNTDWSNWDALYFYAQDGGAEFAQDELAAPALQSAQLTLMAVLDAKAKVLTQQAYDLTNDKSIPADRYATVVNSIQATMKQDRYTKDCGLFTVASDSMMLCWQPIRRGDHSGGFVGTVLMGRLLDEHILERMRTQSAIDFRISPIASKASIKANQKPSAFLSQKITLNRPSAEIVTATLTGLNGEPALEVTMHYSGEVSRNGEQITRWIMSSLLLVEVLSGGFLIVGVHLLLVRRIKRLSTELNQISGSTQWTSRISRIPGNDELSSLSRDANQLLGVIEAQVRSLEALSLTDPLTQLANRRAFDQRLTMEMDISARSGLPLALLALDVDCFKLFNDNYGHPAGDSALKIVSEIMRLTASRPSDLAARIGGEEFAILLPNTSLAGAEALARRLCSQLSERKIAHAFSTAADYLTVSVGVTVAGHESTYSLVARADNAVYQSKNNGRNRVTALPPPSEQSLYEITISD